ncbi:ABC transporter protein, ATP binding protein component [Rubellimicrobium mesophilum DSM 19309]|uniref:ABC transporter protein, ATP binding protein component n=1 Tax=Rubellimicrobium mesophilum DSM 19309 TaxID=442562 RepID=A0A017HM64_9RHOB|nr:sugar ABC transporter ATP-binding protein [Rubellimicrobium mesophilum]EYD75552.1 ABC transporter protein, ATP binding protein component [Rubellimicrobium mesophilum DSM 19309]
MEGPAIRIRDLRKAFGPNQVLRGIDLDLPSGAVTVLMGANGAGKSTLVKVLCGVHSADAGTVTLDGRPFAPASPAQALRAGVVTVHQNINDGVVPDLDVASNLLLDQIADGSVGVASGRALRQRARGVAEAVGLRLDLGRPVAGLPLADRQLVAIARAMAHKPRLLILDEPTSSLSAAEADRLFALIDRLRAQGVALLYISHRMSDIRRIADRIVSMRDGVVSGLFEEKPLDTAGAVRAMLGRDLSDAAISIPAAGRVILSMAGIVLRQDALPFDLTACANEVVAITGLVGSGKSALAAALFGQSAPLAGTMTLDGSPYAPASPIEAVARGVFLSPRDRRANALVADFDIARNLSLPFLRRHSWGSFIRWRSEAAMANRMVGEMGVICRSPRDGILTLSGGNQQKVAVGRWMSEASRLLVLDEPFQGVDIQARRDIGAKVRATAKDRATVVLVAELDEAMEIADRILVMAEHSLAGEHRNQNLDLSAVMRQVTEAQQGAAA